MPKAAIIQTILSQFSFFFLFFLPSLCVWLWFNYYSDQSICSSNKFQFMFFFCLLCSIFRFLVIASDQCCNDDGIERESKNDDNKWIFKLFGISASNEIGCIEMTCAFEDSSDNYITTIVTTIVNVIFFLQR